MPFALAPLAVLAAAAVALMILYGGVLLAKFMAALIPNLPVIGSKLRDAVESGFSAAIGSISDAVIAVLKPATLLFNGLAWSLGRLVLVTRNAINHIDGKANYLMNETVPSAIATAATHADTAVSSARHDIGVTTDNLWSQVHADGQGITNLWTHIDNQVVPKVEGEISDVRSWVSDTVVPKINATVAALSSAVTTDFQQIGTELSSFQNIIGSVLPAEIAAVGAAAHAEAAADLTTALQGIENAKQAASSALSASNQFIQSEIATTNAGLSTVEQAVAVTIPNEITGIQSDINLNTIADTVTLPALIAAVAASVVPLAQFVKECGDPMCSEWNSFKSILQDVEGAAGLGSLLLFLANAAKNPAAAAAAFAPEAEGLFNLGRDAVNLAFSL